MNINMNELKLIDTIELDECPICYEVDIINKVCLNCGHECCFECFKTYFFYVLKKKESQLQCFMCRQKINAIHLSKENMFILNCILEEFQNIYNEDSSVDDGVNYVERRNRAFRYIIPILFLYLIYSSYYDNK
jgi:ribosomal protein L32